MMDGISMNKIKHHDLFVIIRPGLGTLHAVDTLDISGEDDLTFHLGNRFTIQSVEQDGGYLDWDVEERGKLYTKYRVQNWDPDSGGVMIKWVGVVRSFEGYKVSIISSELVELSGFCGWFPTLESQSQFESFTYDLVIDIPKDWTVVTPGEDKNEDERIRRYHYDRPIEDIFICASPKFELIQEDVCDIPLKLYLSDDFTHAKEELMDDFVSSVRLITEMFGGLEEENGGTAIVSPRGKEGAEWGFERDGLWVVGQSFCEYLIENDWKVGDLPKSLSLHETIHGWFGIGVDFEEPWLAEAITQYLEVVLTSMMYDDPDIVDSYFEQYHQRVLDHMEGEDRPIHEYTFLDDMYVPWYLKGSWAFWDLEFKVGREEIMLLLKNIYTDHLGRTLSYDDFLEIVAENFGSQEKDVVRHWFEEKGFRPKYRSLE